MTNQELKQLKNKTILYSANGLLCIFHEKIGDMLQVEMLSPYLPPTMHSMGTGAAMIQLFLTPGEAVLRRGEWMAQDFEWVLQFENIEERLGENAADKRVY